MGGFDCVFELIERGAELHILIDRTFVIVSPFFGPIISSFF